MTPIQPAAAALPSMGIGWICAALPLFLGTLLADWAYAASFQVQWKNFAAWLNAGGLVVLGAGLLWACIERLRRRRAESPAAVYLAALVAAFVLGFGNALIHAKDAWAAMPAGLWLSVASLVVLLAAAVLGWPRLQGKVIR